VRDHRPGRGHGVAMMALFGLLLAPAVAQAAAWSVVPSPNASPGNNELHAVASVSANDVWAVGDVVISSLSAHTLIEQWNGTSWSVVKSPNPSSAFNVLDAAAADPSSGQAWAVGQSTAASGAAQTLTEFNP
jgi:hypothetical protein